MRIKEQETRLTLQEHDDDDDDDDSHYIPCTLWITFLILIPKYHLNFYLCVSVLHFYTLILPEDKLPFLTTGNTTGLYRYFVAICYLHLQSAGITHCVISDIDDTLK